MRTSEAHGHKVVSSASAVTVGRIDRFVIDVPARHIVGFFLKKTIGAGDTLSWSNVAAFGTDAVTVASDSAVVVADGRLKELGDKRFVVQGKRVLSQAGVELGIVKDVDFDPADGTVRALLTDREEIPGSRLIDVGSYAVIVAVA
jgi:sporulation protein YlmC with PRC-barrel domain